MGATCVIGSVWISQRKSENTVPPIHSYATQLMSDPHTSRQSSSVTPASPASGCVEVPEPYEAVRHAPCGSNGAQKMGGNGGGGAAGGGGGEGDGGGGDGEGGGSLSAAALS